MTKHSPAPVWFARREPAMRKMFLLFCICIFRNSSYNLIVLHSKKKKGCCIRFGSGHPIHPAWMMAPKTQAAGMPIIGMSAAGCADCQKSLRFGFWRNIKPPYGTWMKVDGAEHPALVKASAGAGIEPQSNPSQVPKKQAARRAVRWLPGKLPEPKAAFLFPCFLWARAKENRAAGGMTQ